MTQYRLRFSLCCGQYRLWQSRLRYSLGNVTVWVMVQYRLWQVEVVASRGCGKYRLWQYRLWQYS